MHTAIGEDTMLILNMVLLLTWNRPGLEVNLFPSFLLSCYAFLEMAGERAYSLCYGEGNPPQIKISPVPEEGHVLAGVKAYSC